MSNAKIVAKALLECGIGSRFSRFHLSQYHEYFSLTDIDSEVGTELCLVAHDKIDRKRFNEISGPEALAYGLQHREWPSYLHTAQKVMAKIVRKPGSDFENKYLVDPAHGSVYVVNQMYVIEVSPKFRPVPELPTQTVFRFLEEHDNLVGEVAIHVFTVHGRVAVLYDGCLHSTNLTPSEFDDRYGEQDAFS